MGKVVVPKTGQKPPSPRGDGTDYRPIRSVILPALRPVLLPVLRPVLLPAHPSVPLPGHPPGPLPDAPPALPALPLSRATLFFGEEADGWARNFINFLILEKEG